MIQAKTRDNPYLSPEYIQSLIDTYPPALINAYLEGEFVNLKSSTVYNVYDRGVHDSREQIIPGEPLRIGCDFNIDNTAAVIYVMRGKDWHGVAELAKVRDTTILIENIKARWDTHPITVYPDSSGTQRSNANSTNPASIALLKQAGFAVRAKEKNALVKDRVMAMNKALASGNVYINYRNCPVTAQCLEQQSYDKNGDPDKKSGHDHQNDAATYPIAYEMPIKRPLFTIDFSFPV